MTVVAKWELSSSIFIRRNTFIIIVLSHTDTTQPHTHMKRVLCNFLKCKKSIDVHLRLCASSFSVYTLQWTISCDKARKSYCWLILKVVHPHTWKNLAKACVSSHIQCEKCFKTEKGFFLQFMSFVHLNNYLLPSILRPCRHSLRAYGRYTNKV